MAHRSLHKTGGEMTLPAGPGTADPAQAAATRSEAQARPSRGRWAAVLFVVFYVLAALALLWQWDAPRPWSRLDVFSAGFLLVSVVWAVATLRSHRAIFTSREVLREASGLSFDRWMLRWIVIFLVAGLAVYADYGHWRLVPALQLPALQWLGLGLYGSAAVWLIWVDRHLASQFRQGLRQRSLMRKGPYGIVRHPRYLAVILSQAAFALALASVIGWFLAAAWLAINLYRIKLEEMHLRKLFGAAYEEYAAHTARLIPGLY